MTGTTGAIALDSRLVGSFSLALFVAVALTPIAHKAALASGLVDRPEGWKTHMHPTPFLGGAAVLAGVISGSLLAPDLRTVALLLGAASVLSLVGTLDDAIHVDVRLRLLLELAAACFLWAFDLGWRLDAHGGINLVLTCVWVVAVINAFNIIDLIDTVATSLLVASAGGLAVLAYLEGETTASVMSIAIVGAALGFLPFNTRPSHIFLGDGGTMSLGFLVAAVAMLALDGGEKDPRLFLVAPLLFCVPLVDAVWRAMKRMKAGVTLMTAGHDSLANSLQRVVVTPSRVGLFLAAAQALCITAAVISTRGGPMAAGVAAIFVGASLLGLMGMSSGPLLRRFGALLSRD